MNTVPSPIVVVPVLDSAHARCSIVVVKEDSNLLLCEPEFIGEEVGEHRVDFYIVEIGKIANAINTD
jgi:hypothetical protein